MRTIRGISLSRYGSGDRAGNGSRRPASVRTTDINYAANVNRLPASQEDIDIAELERFRKAVAGKRAYFPIKRGFDILVSAALLVLLSPLMVTVAILVRITSSGPALYRAPRYGQNGKRFIMLKFRSMAVAREADDRAFRLRVSGDGVLAKSAADPRVTTLGRRIRRLSIDELPQLINVFLGDMSLVGPRPVLPEMLANYPMFNRARTMVRPGVGGLWQVRERTNATHVAYMWQHDLEYLERLSLRCDLEILLRTAVVTIRRSGAA